MKKPLKILRIILIALLVFIIVVSAAVGLFADRALKAGIETAGSSTLKVDVTLDEADLSLLGGSLGLRSLAVANPPGYQHDTLLQLAKGDVAVNIRSLTTDIVSIKHIRLDGMTVTIEQKGVSTNNLQEVLDSLPAAPQKEPGPESKPEPSGKKLHIAELELTNVTVNAKLLPIPGKADTVTLKLDPILLEDLGGDNKLDTAGLVAEVLRAVAGGIAAQGGGVLPEDMLDDMGATLGKTIEAGKKLLEGVDLGKPGEGPGGDLGKQVEDLGKGLKGILDSKK